MTLGSVALVHDYLNQRGGAERVVLALTELWPEAPLYTTLYRPDSTFDGFRTCHVRTSALDRVPVDAAFRALFPLYPAAIRSLGVIDADVVLSSSSGWAHAVRTSPRALHAVYCYTPARWLHFHEPAAGPALPAPVARAFRRWDINASRRADLYIAVSDYVRDRIRTCYGRDAPVVYPPVEVERFTPKARGERLLVVCRMLARKRVDLLVDAATRAQLPLDVVGDGPALDDLRHRAGPSVVFHGELPDADVTELFESCRTLVQAGEEDFGLTLVEAQAAGKPVVALAAGGALETVEEGVSGAFFAESTPEALLVALRRCDSIGTAPEELRRRAERFSGAVFARTLTSVLNDAAALKADEAPERSRVR